MMASAPCLREPRSFVTRGSGSLNDEYSPQRATSSSRSLNDASSSSRYLSSSPLLADYEARIHPFDDDDGFSELGCAPLGSPSLPLLCSSKLLERHVFLCFKEPQSWPSVVEGADSDRLPRFLAAAIKTRKNEMMMKTRLIICEGRDGTDLSNGDVMIFPDMIHYKGLTHFDVDAFVDEVLVRNRDWLPGRPKKLLGTYVFVCAHGNREVNFGVLGPAIIEAFMDQIASRRLGAHVFVKPCSYIGGLNKFARNLIVYSSNNVGKVSGHCYGSVTPDNVSCVLDDFHMKGFLPGVNDRLQDIENEQAFLHSPSQDCSVNSCTVQNRSHCNHEQCVGHVNGEINTRLDGQSRLHGLKALGKGQDNTQQKRTYTSSRWWQASWWFCFWEKEDTLATLVVVGAAASVCLAYHVYKSHSRP